MRSDAVAEQGQVTRRRTQAENAPRKTGVEADPIPGRVTSGAGRRRWSGAVADAV